MNVIALLLALAAGPIPSNAPEPAPVYLGAPGPQPSNAPEIFLRVAPGPHPSNAPVPRPSSRRTWSGPISVGGSGGTGQSDAKSAKAALVVAGFAWAGTCEGDRWLLTLFDGMPASCPGATVEAAGTVLANRGIKVRGPFAARAPGPEVGRIPRGTAVEVTRWVRRGPQVWAEISR